VSNIGQNIRKARLQRGIKITHLAQLTGISRRTLQYVERGVSIPRISTVQAIARVLGVNMGVLINGAS
jgi:transcriptional regulator with XRE-family HTH domain